MSDTPGHLEAEVELRPGEKLTLPAAKGYAVELPFRFPDPLVEAARRAEAFQRLPRETRLREIASLMELGLAMTRASERREWIERRLAEQEDRWRQSQQELFARHAG